MDNNNYELSLHDNYDTAGQNLSHQITQDSASSNPGQDGAT